ncbi:MAG: metallophosphoesterase family protein [Mycoplasmoidaceae bacterium]
MLKKILICSDTHGNNKYLEEAIALNKPDVVLHAGDFCCSISLIKEMVDYVVSGNNDTVGEEELYFSLFGVNVYMTHGHQFISYFCKSNENSKRIYKSIRNKGLNLIVYGHTHVEEVGYVKKTLIINPGSISSPRNSSNRKSYAIITIKDNKIVEKTFDEIIRYI